MRRMVGRAASPSSICTIPSIPALLTIRIIPITMLTMGYGYYGLLWVTILTVVYLLWSTIPTGMPVSQDHPHPLDLTPHAKPGARSTLCWLDSRNP